jgi:hypothetical protein
MPGSKSRALAGNQRRSGSRDSAGKFRRRCGLQKRSLLRAGKRDSLLRNLEIKTEPWPGFAGGGRGDSRKRIYKKFLKIFFHARKSFRATRIYTMTRERLSSYRAALAKSSCYVSRIFVAAWFVWIVRWLGKPPLRRSLDRRAPNLGARYCRKDEKTMFGSRISSAAADFRTFKVLFRQDLLLTSATADAQPSVTYTLNPEASTQQFF